MTDDATFLDDLRAVAAALRLRAGRRLDRAILRAFSWTVSEEQSHAMAKVVVTSTQAMLLLGPTAAHAEALARVYLAFRITPGKIGAATRELLADAARAADARARRDDRRAS